MPRKKRKPLPIDNSERARAAACYALPANLREHERHGQQHPRLWPWPDEDFKSMEGGYTPAKRKKELEQAIELLQAEIKSLKD